MHITELDARAFTKADPTSDTIFYTPPRMVAHINERAVAAVSRLYAEHLTDGMCVLDLMSSRYSHLPQLDLDVTGHGMNEAELSANFDLASRVVRNLNDEPNLPFDIGSFNAALCCVSVQYLQRPVAVFEEVARVLRTSAMFIVTFSNRCFPTKAIALWHVLNGIDRARYIKTAMAEAGFTGLETRGVLLRMVSVTPYGR